MATTARSSLRQTISEHLGDWQSMTTTSAGNAGGTTLVDTGLADLSPDTDFCKDWYVLITELVSGGPAVGELKKISSYVVATNTITVNSAFTAQVKTGTNYELHKIDPNLIHQAINRASILSFPSGSVPGLYVALRDESLVVDNLLTNPSFDTWTGSAFTGWTSIGTPTLAQETTRKVHGTGSASIAATGATEGLEQNLYTAVNIREVVGKTLHVRGWAFCATASSARIRVTFDGSAYTNGSWHGGDAEWESHDLQKIDVAVPADATEMTVSCEMESGVTGYFDHMAAWIDRVRRYTIVTTMKRGPFQVLQQANEDEPDGDYAPLVTPVSGRVLRLIGMGSLTQPSTDAATIEIGEPQVQLFVAHAMAYIYQVLGAPGAGAYLERDALEKERNYWKAEVARMSRDHLYTMPQMSASWANHSWTTEEDSSGKYLVVKRGW